MINPDLYHLLAQEETPLPGEQPYGEGLPLLGEDSLTLPDMPEVSAPVTPPLDPGPPAKQFTAVKPPPPDYAAAQANDAHNADLANMGRATTTLNKVGGDFWDKFQGKSQVQGLRDHEMFELDRRLKGLNVGTEEYKASQRDPNSAPSKYLQNLSGELDLGMSEEQRLLMSADQFDETLAVGKQRKDAELKALLESGRNNRQQNVRDDKWNEKVIQGYDWARGVPEYTRGDAEKMRKLQGGVKRTLRAASQMQAMMERYSQSKVIPDDVKAVIESLSAEMTLAMKDTEAFGALQSAEFDFMRKVIPDPTSLKTFLFDPVNGAGNMARVKKLIELSQAQEADRAADMGLVRAGAVAPVGEGSLDGLTPPINTSTQVQEPVVAPELQQNTVQDVKDKGLSALKGLVEQVFPKKAAPKAAQDEPKAGAGVKVQVIRNALGKVIKTRWVDPNGKVVKTVDGDGTGR